MDEFITDYLSILLSLILPDSAPKVTVTLDSANHLTEGDFFNDFHRLAVNPLPV
jgi:hypothetical protein